MCFLRSICTSGDRLGRKEFVVGSGHCKISWLCEYREDWNDVAGCLCAAPRRCWVCDGTGTMCME